jgi:glycosyltransferase involved in cell wall biosynthesis
VSGNATSLAVVVCAYSLERREQLVAAVESLRAQTRPVDQIVIVIDHNDELLAEMRDRFPGHSVVPNAYRRGLSGARNTGIEQTTKDVVAFLDDDARASAQWAERLMPHYDDPDVIGAGGRIDSDWARGRPRWFPREFDWVVGCTYLGMPTELADVRNMIGANMSLRRDVFTRVGDFSGAVGRTGKLPVGCEETELCIRALADTPGGRIVHDPGAPVDHLVTPERATWRYFRKRCYMEGVSKAQVVAMAGAQSGLSSERSYTLKVLPRGFFRGLAGPLRGDFAGPLRAAAIFAGLAITTAGYLRSKFFGLPRAVRAQADPDPPER